MVCLLSSLIWTSIVDIDRSYEKKTENPPRKIQPANSWLLDMIILFFGSLRVKPECLERSIYSEGRVDGGFWKVTRSLPVTILSHPHAIPSPDNSVHGSFLNLRSEGMELIFAWGFLLDHCDLLQVPRTLKSRLPAYPVDISCESEKCNFKRPQSIHAILQQHSLCWRLCFPFESFWFIYLIFAIFAKSRNLLMVTILMMSISCSFVCQARSKAT